MPTFHWKGRTADGLEQQGDISGTSKRAALDLLKAQRIMVTSLSGGGDDPAEFSFGAGDVRRPARPRTSTSAAAAGTLVQRLQQQRATVRPRRVRGLLVAAGFLLAAFVLGRVAFLSPSHTYWVPLLVAALLAGLGLLTLGLTLVSLSRNATDRLYTSAGTLAASVEAAERERESKGL